MNAPRGRSPNILLLWNPKCQLCWSSLSDRYGRLSDLSLVQQLGTDLANFSGRNQKYKSENCIAKQRETLQKNKVLNFRQGGSDWMDRMSEPTYIIDGSELKSVFRTRLNRFMII